MSVYIRVGSEITGAIGWKATWRDHSYGRIRSLSNLEMYEFRVGAARDYINANTGLKDFRGRFDMDFPIHMNVGKPGTALEA